MYKKRPVILAINDQPVILHTVASELREQYLVKTFTSGQVALRYLERESADLVLLDYDMPKMNGIEVLRRLKDDTRTSGIPVIFLTGSESGDTEAEVLGQGASDYIHKPIKAQILLTCVRLQLELARYRNHLESLVEEQTEHLRQANEKLKLREDITLNLLAETTEMRDHNTGDHIIRTTKMVQIIVASLLQTPAHGYVLSPNEADNIINSAKLHDLGKIAIPDRILLKLGKLDGEEFGLIRRHPSYSAALFDKYIMQSGEDSFLSTVRDIALYHHEKWDGTGYPQGIKGASIPLSARITALADVYDALTSTRPYKESFTHEKAVSIIEGDSETLFDPYLVSVFMKHDDDFRVIAESASHKNIDDTG